MGLTNIGDKCVEYEGDIDAIDPYSYSGNEILERVGVETVNTNDGMYNDYSKFLILNL